MNKNKFYNSPLNRLLLNLSYKLGKPLQYPMNVDICATQRCTENCQYCWHRGDYNAEIRYNSLTQFISDISHRITPKISITGGEPIYWHKLFDFLDFCKSKKIRDILFCTNGNCLSKMHNVQRLIKYGVNSVSLSLDTLDTNKFRTLRGYPVNNVLTAINNCLKVRAFDEGFNIGISTVISKQTTLSDIEDLHTFCTTHKITQFFQCYSKTNNIDIDNKFYISHIERRDLFKNISWISPFYKSIYLSDKHPLQNKNKSKCILRFNTIKVFPNGNISFCWTSKIIGNIFDNSFESIWQSAKANKIRNDIYNCHCDCDFDCDIYDNLDQIKKYIL